MIEQRPTIRRNVEAWLAHHGITGVEITEEFPDRVRAFDHQGLLLEYAITNNWDYGTGDNHTWSTKGDTTRGSWREHATPSMQIVLHDRKMVGDDGYARWAKPMLEIDFDENSPNVNLPGHIVEVSRNKLLKVTTDQAKIAAGLMRRGIEA